MILFAGIHTSDFLENIELMAKHFDIGAWSKEQKRLKQKSLELNSTIAELNEEISLKEQTVKHLKRKVSCRKDNIFK